MCAVLGCGVRRGVEPLALPIVRRESGVLAALGETDQPLSEMIVQYNRYVASGEINSMVDDTARILDDVERHFGNAEIDRLEGLTVRVPGGAWFNLRASNTEPLLRLNVEAPDEHTMTQLRDDVLAIVQS
ncbi:hypothetical protein [Nocardia beijingensis]|uniref:hypothetical protein n=1 Tax=Nocardia beijingensis TaxID=95162 RepID=UPI002B4B5EBB|nr:hypothetical protein [Nocardia beijingensis]